MLKIYNVFFGLAVLASTAGCSIKSGTYISYQIGLINDQTPCSSFSDTIGFIENGSGQLEIFPPMNDLGEYLKAHDKSLLKKFSKLDNDEKLDINWNPKNYIAQSNPELCWAATLAMAFRHVGWPYGEEDFVRANKIKCNTQGATIRQIIFALVSVHTDGTADLSDLRRAADSNPSFLINYRDRLISRTRGHKSKAGTAKPSLVNSSERFSPLNQIEWLYLNKYSAPKKGGIHFVSGTSDLINAIRRKNPVIAGINLNGMKHVVLIRKVRARLGGTKIGGSYYSLPDDAKIEFIEFIDPMGTVREDGMTGDEFLKHLYFAFELRA